jgi:hypothetical protein
MKLIFLLLLIWCVKYIVDRFKNKKEDIGIDNTIIIGASVLLLMIIFI